MSSLQFEQETFKSRTILGEPASPKMVKALLRVGIVKNEQQAVYILLGVAVFCFILAVYISYVSFFDSSDSKLTPQQEKQNQEFLDKIQQRRPPAIKTQ